MKDASLHQLYSHAKTPKRKTQNAKRKTQNAKRKTQALAYQPLEPRKLLAALDFTGSPFTLPSDTTANAYLFIGDHSGSNSELWSIDVDGRRIESPDFGDVQRVRGTFERGESYNVSVSHLATNRSSPDFDYRAWIDRSAAPRWTSGDPVPGSSDFFVTDADSLFQRRFFGSSSTANPTQDKSATIHFPKIDVDIDSGGSGSLDRNVGEEILEADSRSGKSIPVYLGDLDSDGVVDNFDFDGIAGVSFEEISVELSSNLSLLDDAISRITFDFEDAGLTAGSDRLFRIWTRDAFEARSESDLVRSGVQYDATELGLVPGKPLTLYVEAVNPTRRTVHHDAIAVSASIASAGWSSSLSDEIHVRGTNDPEGFAPGGSESDYDHNCVDGRLCVVDDTEAFLDLTLADGGVRNIDVRANDHYVNLDALPHQTTFSPAGDSGVAFAVFNAPESYEIVDWYQSATGEGTYEFGTFTLNVEFGSVNNVGEYAVTSYPGEMTLRARGRDEITFPIVFSSSTNRNYTSDDFGSTTSQISTTVQTQYGSHGLSITFDQYSAFGPFSLSGDISSTGIDIIDFSQPRHGNASPAFVYTPDEGTTATVDSFTYTLSTLLGENETATVNILADPDVVSVEAVDNIAWEVPPHNFDYDNDEATFRFSRQNRPDEPIGNDHDTTIYFTISSGADESDKASLSDWHSAQINPPVGYQLQSDGSSDLVYAVTIPSGETFVDVVIRATNDQDYEIDETLDFTIVNSYFPGHAGQHTDQSEAIEASYRIGNAKSTVTIIDRTADIDIASEDEKSEDTPGSVFSINDDDDDQDGVPDYLEQDSSFVDDDLVMLSIQSLIPEEMNFVADFFTIAFDVANLRLWVDQRKSDEITLDTQFDEAEKSHSVWVEAVGLNSGSIGLVWHESGEANATTRVFDTIQYSVLGIDVDIDSDNDGTYRATSDGDPRHIDHSAWEETLEDNVYGLGKLVPKGSFDSLDNPRGGIPLTPFTVRLPVGLDLNDASNKIRFDHKFESAAGKISIFSTNTFDERTGEGLREFFPGDTLTLKELSEIEEIGFSAESRQITLWIRGWDEAPGGRIGRRLSDLGELKSLGKPQETIKVTLIAGSKEFSDEVKYIVTNEESIFWEIQKRQELRASFAANGVYSNADLPNYGLEILTDAKLVELGLSNLHLNGAGPLGFNASLYRDYVTGPNSYILTFQGTNFESVADWGNNFGQAVGAGGTQFTAAMTLSDRLVSELPGLTGHRGNLDLTVSGHSLGGGLASAAAVWTGLQGSTFNSSGLQKETINARHLDDLQRTEEGRPEALVRFDNARNFLTTYHNKMDILTVIQQSSPLIPNALGALGIPLPLSGPFSQDGDAAEAGLTLGKIILLLVTENANGEPSLNFDWDTRLAVGLAGLNEIGSNGLQKLIRTHSYYQYGLLGRSLYGDWLLDDGSPDPNDPAELR